MQNKISQLREKSHLDIPIVILSIMFSFSLNKFDPTIFHLTFTLLVIVKILSKALHWNLTTILSSENNHFIIISSYAQKSLLFAVYYSFPHNHGYASLFYVCYSLFLLLYVVLVCIKIFEFGEMKNSFSIAQAWAIFLIIMHLGYFAFTVVSVSIPNGVEFVVFFNICLILLVGYIFEKQAKLKNLEIITVD